MLEETLKSFKLDVETEERVKQVIKEFDLVEKINRIADPQIALKKIRSRDRDLIYDLYIGSFARKILFDYKLYLKSQIGKSLESLNFSAYLRSALTQEAESPVTQDGRKIIPLLYQQYILEKSVNKTSNDFHEWVKKKLRDDDILNQIMQVEPIYTHIPDYSQGQVIQSAFVNITIPTDPNSLSQILDMIGGIDENAKINGLIDLIYLVRPFETAALERKKIGRRELIDYVRGHLESDTGEKTGTNRNNDFLPFNLMTSIIPFRTYQENGDIKNRLIGMSLNFYRNMRYEEAIHQINTQLSSHPNDPILYDVLTTVRDKYLKPTMQMPKDITWAGR